MHPISADHPATGAISNISKLYAGDDMNTKVLRTLIVFIAVSLLAACSGQGNTPASEVNSDGSAPAQLILGAYSTPREAYGELLPIFSAQWKEKTGQEVTFEESYQGSGAQARAINEGFEADVAALSLDGDIQKIADAD